MTAPQIVLASTSRYRRALLRRLGLPFRTASPDVNETVEHHEAPVRLVERLAEAKARAVSNLWSDALIIGSDQVAVLDGAILGKPGNHDANVHQLLNASGRRVEFFTGLCLLNTKTSHVQVDCVPFAVVFRSLSVHQIDHYVRREKPFDCVGGFKAEGLGIGLFQHMEGNDPTALIGLPLIRLVGMLEQEGVDVLAYP